ncbi:MAG: hypothetical protein R2788_24795 [Saprospiraceae bacterium]
MVCSKNQAEIDAHTNITDGELLQPNAKPGDIRFLDSNGDGVFDEGRPHHHRRSYSFLDGQST